MTRFIPSPDTEKDYRRALSRYATGVTVVTCLSEHGPLGMTANSFASVSMDPPLVLWSPAKSSSRHAAFVAADRFIVHVLGKGQTDLCNRFTSSGLDFDQVAYSDSTGGAPLIEGCLAHFECSQFAVHDGGDHSIIVGKVEAAAAQDGEPLVFSGGDLGGFLR